jgi:hypothetical protein
MVRRLAWIFVMVLAARPLSACSMAQFDPNELRQNETFTSPNGRYVAVHRAYDNIPDFTSVRAGDLSPGEPSDVRIAALYEQTTHGRRLLREIETVAGDADVLLVSDDGVSVIAARRLGHICGYTATADDALITIYAGGQRIGAFKVRDVLTSYDIRMIKSVEFALRRESDTRESVVLTFPAPQGKFVERRIDVATAQLIDPVVAIYPAPRVSIRAESAPRELLLPPRECASQWDDPNIVRVEPQMLFDLARTQPLPPFPDLMIKANIRGIVRVDVLVSEEGRVLCARASQLPFGGSEAALKAVREWTFRPLVIEGKPVKFAGEVLFSFKDVGE